MMIDNNIQGDEVRHFQTVCEKEKDVPILPASCVTFLGLVLLLPTVAVRAQELQVEIVQPPMRFLTADTGKEQRTIGAIGSGDGPGANVIRD